MQNDFEKRVQLKLEELNFAPSEPVWTNIEKEIRKKDKRRFFIWIPFLFVLLGGGLYWNHSLNKRSINRSAIENNDHSKNKASVTTSTNNTKTSTEKNTDIQKGNNELNSII